MKKITSFTINHNLLREGIYLSRVDKDIITYDLRMRIPNNDDYMENDAIHTIEHLFATYARNSSYGENIIYFGPMGCRTGFYLLVRDTIDEDSTIQLILDSFSFIKNFEDKVPGTDKIECGNYKEHNLIAAKKEASKYLEKIKNWNKDKLIYPE